MNKQQYILGLKDGYNLKKEQVLNRVRGAIASAGLPMESHGFAEAMETHGSPKATPVCSTVCSTAINDMGKVETLKQTKAGCLVIAEGLACAWHRVATEEEVEKIALSNPDLFVELEIIHEKY